MLSPPLCVCLSLRCIRYNWNTPRKPTPSAIGIGSHVTLVFLSAELSRDRKDSFLWNCSYVGRVVEKLRDGGDKRAYAVRGARGHRVRTGARGSWAQTDRIATPFEDIRAVSRYKWRYVQSIWRAVGGVWPRSVEKATTRFAEVTYLRAAWQG